MPRKKPDDDPVGTPKKTNRRFTKQRAPRKPRISAPAAETPEPKLDAPPLRVIDGEAIPAYPRELADPTAGDKTPAVIQWYRENHPEAAEKLYRGRVIPV